MKTKVLVATLSVFFICLGVILVINYSNNNTLSEKDKILHVIIEEIPIFEYEGEPVVKVSSASGHDRGWYIATIESIHHQKNRVPVRLALHESSGKLRIIAGPDTYFSEDELLKYNMPDSAILELRKP